jgi:hypothetical protein
MLSDKKAFHRQLKSLLINSRKINLFFHDIARGKLIVNICFDFSTDEILKDDE